MVWEYVIIGMLAGINIVLLVERQKMKRQQTNAERENEKERSRLEKKIVRLQMDYYSLLKEVGKNREPEADTEKPMNDKSD